MTTITPGSRGYRPSRGDRGALWVFIIAGIVLTIMTAVFAVIRITKLLGDDPTPVEVELGALPAKIGTGASALSIHVESATVYATNLSPASLTWGITGPVLATLTTAALTVALVLLAASLLRGQIFSRRNSGLVISAGLTGLIGFTVVKLMHTALANSVLIGMPEQLGSSAAFSFQPGTFLLAAFVVALVSTVFVIGERLQRDTEGLV